VTGYTEGFSHFVTSMTAPVASGWSVRRVGLAPTGKRRLSRRALLGSGLIDQSQKMTVAAVQIAEKKVWAQRSYHPRLRAGYVYRT
jgi:hypothetical protein